MSSREFKGRFRSPVGSLMEQFVHEKQACGYRYGEEAHLLARFDRFLCDEALAQCQLPARSAASGSPNNPTRAYPPTITASAPFVNSPCTCAGWDIPPMCRIDR